MAQFREHMAVLIEYSRNPITLLESQCEMHKLQIGHAVERARNLLMKGSD